MPISSTCASRPLRQTFGLTTTTSAGHWSSPRATSAILLRASHCAVITARLVRFLALTEDSLAGCKTITPTSTGTSLSLKQRWYIKNLRKLCTTASSSATLYCFLECTLENVPSRGIKFSPSLLRIKCLLFAVMGFFLLLWGCFVILWGYFLLVFEPFFSFLSHFFVKKQPKPALFCHFVTLMPRVTH